MRPLIEILRNEDGVAAAEYAVMLALILMGIIAAIGNMGTETGGLLGRIYDDLHAAGFGG